MSNFSSYNYLKRNKVWDKLTSHDIVINIKETYPQKVLDMCYKDDSYKEDKIIQYLEDNSYCILGIHCSRLTKYEINDIKRNGLRYGNKETLINKIKNLPQEVPYDIKIKLLKHINSLKSSVFNNNICCSCGYLDFSNDSGCNKIFTDNWGGEVIYNYYNHNGIETDEEKYIAKILNSISYPCIIFTRARITQSSTKYLRFSDLVRKGTENTFDTLTGHLIIDNEKVEVIDIIKIDE